VKTKNVKLLLEQHSTHTYIRLPNQVSLVVYYRNLK